MYFLEFLINWKSSRHNDNFMAGMIVTKAKNDYRALRPRMINMGCNMDSHQAFMTGREWKMQMILLLTFTRH